MIDQASRQLAGHLRQIVGPDGIRTSPSDVLIYECDGYTTEKNKPSVVAIRQHQG